jgi:hypothetical protein
MIQPTCANPPGVCARIRRPMAVRKKTFEDRVASDESK